jgi:Sulfotransferase family
MRRASVSPDVRRVQESALPESCPKPNFFLVGAAKAGTTSLYNYLSQHPQIFMSPIKEPHFLADEVRLENFTAEVQDQLERWEVALREYLRGPMSERFPSGPVADWQDYLKLFQYAGTRPAIGEASPCYLWSQTAPQNIAARFPDAKLIMVLRNPVERAFAQHLHTLSVLKCAISFREHMDAALGSTSRQIGELYPFLEFGLYSEQVKRYFGLFPREKTCVLFYENYLRDPMGLLREIFRFLGVDESFAPDLSARHMESRVPRWFGLNRVLRQSGIWASAKRLIPPDLRRRLRPVIFRPRTNLELNLIDRSRLVDFYRADVEKLSALLKKDLSAWLDAPSVRR